MHEFIRSATSFESLATVRVRGAFAPRAARKREFAQRDRRVLEDDECALIGLVSGG